MPGQQSTISLFYENDYATCHNGSVHSRNYDKAHSIDKIRLWVIRCSKHLELYWEKHDVGVITFLNLAYLSLYQRTVDRIFMPF